MRAKRMHQNSTPKLQLKACSLCFHQAPTARLEMAGFVGQMEKGPKKHILFPTLCLPHPGPETKWLHQPWAVSWGAAARVQAPPTTLQHLHKELLIAATSSPRMYIVFTSPGLLMGGGRLPIHRLKSHLKLEKKMSGGRERERQYYKLAFTFVN